MTAAATTALAALGLAAGSAQAQTADPQPAASGASVTLLTPFPGATFTGSKQIEISAFYQDTSASGGIESVEILIDGQSAATKTLDKPELRGVVSFMIDPSTLDTGTHQIQIRVKSVSGDHAAVRTSISYSGDGAPAGQQNPGASGVSGAEGVTVLAPRPSDHVSGIVTIKVDAADPSGAQPYVSVFIDKVFKSLRNHPPYTFDWDTTRTTNGWHTIEVSGFNDFEQIGKTAPIRVYVNNGGGDTTIDRGLSDAPATATAQPAASSAAAPAPASPAPARSAAAGKPAPEQAASVPSRPAPVAASAPRRVRSASAPTAAPMPVSPAQLAQAPAPSPERSVVNSRLAAPATDGVVDAQATMQAPAASELPAIGRKHSRAASVKAAAAAVAPARLAKKDAPQPAVSVGAQLLASAGYVPGQFDPRILLDAPFLAGRAKVAEAAATAGQQAAGRPVRVKVMSQEVAGPRLAISHAAVHSAAHPPLRMASAGYNPAPGQTPILSTPSVAPVHIDMSNIPHEAVSVARPASGLFSLAARHRLAGQYMVVMNDRAVTMDRPIQDHGNVLCAPIRQIFESEGGVLFWSPKTKTVHAFTPDRDVKIQVGSKKASVNNQDQKLSAAPYISAGRTMIPVGFLPSALNVTVTYDAATGHLEINSKD